ncbi:hypothetical protein FQN50_003742 [Emmonsiellopsis sp. PD_5]|nr:hypothetical protein FQN50_003742 [Emmonsiellopsis sp. PD_5]
MGSQTQTHTETETIVLQHRGVPPNTATATDNLTLQAEPEPDNDTSPPPEIKWLYPKLISAGFSFFVAGVNDGSLGALIPYVLRTYNLQTNLVVVVYLTTFLGWLFAALTNSTIIQYLGTGSIIALGAALQVLAHALRAWLPPFPLYAVTFFLASLGQAYNDTHANTFVAEVRSAHRWLGFIHAMYMAGCLVGPFVATAVAVAVGGGGDGRGGRWCLFYLFPMGLGVVNLVLVGGAFRDRLRVSSVADRDRGSGQGEDVGPERKQDRAIKEMKDTLSVPSVWLMSLFYFFFIGAAITSGGWVVEYLVKIRGGDLKNMGYVPTGLYGGGFLGRLILAEPTYRLGERRMVPIYAVLCVGLQVPNIIVAAIAISLIGFFSGPFFATGVSVSSKLFTPETRSSAIAFIFVLGQTGGAIFPALTGVIAARAGVHVLQPIVVALFVATGVSWMVLPGTSGLRKE